MYGWQSRVEIKHYINGGENVWRQSRVEIKHYITGGQNVWAAVTGRNQTLHYWRRECMGGSHG